MANAREASLILRLIDKVSGPARASAAGLRAVSGAARGLVAASQFVPNSLSRMGRSARRASYDTAPMSAGIMAGAAAAGRAVFEYEKMGNAAEAVGLLTERQREQLEAYGKVLNKDFPFINRDILEASFELLRSGQNFEQMMGSLRSTLNTSLAGDIGLGRTADIMTNVAQAMRLPMESSEQVQETMRDIADVLAYGATNSNTDIEEMAVAFRYVAPLAAATSMSLREMATATMMMANNGIKGSNAGTGLRFALIRMLKPTKGALAAFQRLNIEIGDFVKGAQSISADQLAASLSLDGINVSGLEGQIDEILKDPRFSKSPAKLIAQLTDLISKEAADAGVLDTKTISDSLADSLLVLGTKVDLRGFLNAVRDKPEAEALFPTIFGARHAAKIMAIMAGDFDGTLRDMEENAKGAADRMARIRMKGLVGDVARFRAAIDNFIMTLSTTGVMETAVKSLNALTDGIRALGDVNPQLLELGTYGLLALAVITPLGFALSGLAAVAALLLNPLVLVGGALAALAGYLSFKHWEKITSTFSGFWSSLKHNLGPKTIGVVNSAKEKFSELWSTLMGDHVTGSEFAWRKWGSEIGKGAAIVLEYTVGFAQGIARYISSSIDGIGRMISASMQYIDDLKQKISDFIDWASSLADSWFSIDAWAPGQGVSTKEAFAIADDLAALRRIRDLPTTLPAHKSNIKKSIYENSLLIDEATKDWPSEAREKLFTYLELKITETPEALEEAKKIAQEIEDLLSVTAKPTIDQSDLDSTLYKAQQIGKALKALDGLTGPSLGNSPAIRPPRAGETGSVGPQSSVAPGLTPSSSSAAPVGAGRQVAMTNHNHFNIHSTDPMAAAKEVDRRFGTRLARLGQVSMSGEYG